MLIQCPECKQQISEQAASCPKCGRAVEPKGYTTLGWQRATSLGCPLGCLVVAAIFIGALLFIGRRDDSSPTPNPPVLGAEYVVTVTDLGVMDSPTFYYPDPVEFAQHVVLILLPGDVIVPQGGAGLGRLKVRVATHDGKAVYIVGYMPFEFITQKCRLKNPQP